MDSPEKLDGAGLVIARPFRAVLPDYGWGVSQDVRRIFDRSATHQDFRRQGVSESMRVGVLYAALSEDCLEGAPDCFHVFFLRAECGPEMVSASDETSPTVAPLLSDYAKQVSTTRETLSVAFNLAGG